MPKDDDKTDKDGLKLTDNEDFKALTEMVRGLGVLVQQSQKSQSTMQGNFNKLVESMEKQQTAALKKDDDDVDPEALNELDNVKFLKVVLSEVGKVMDEKVGNISESLSQTNANINTTKLKAEFNRLSGEHKDFKDWGNEMAALAKAHPTLELEDLYLKARRGDETKAAELDIKYKKTDDGDKPNPKFMGLFATSGGDDTPEDEKLTAKEAGDKAWEETVASFPLLATSGDG